MNYEYPISNKRLECLLEDGDKTYEAEIARQQAECAKMLQQAWRVEAEKNTISL